MKYNVSVIIPTCGREFQVSTAIGSVLSQSDLPNHHLQLILVDDASPIPIELNEYPSVQVIRHERNKGAAAARNTGVAAAQSDLVAFLDSDDVWLPNKLANQLALFEKLSQMHDPNLLVIGCGFYDPDRRTGALRSRLPMDASDPHLFASGCWFAPGSAVLMSRKAFDVVGIQDENMKRLEDLDWFIRFGQAGGKFFCTRSHDAVIRPSGRAPFDAVMMAVQQLASTYGPSGNTPLPPRSWNRLAAYLSLEKAVAHFGNHQLPASAIELAKTIVRKPRFQPAVEQFWRESADVPLEVQKAFAEMVDILD